MRRIVAAVVAVVVCSAMFTAPSQAAPPVPTPLPSKPTGLPLPPSMSAALDPVPMYIPQNACQPGTPRGVADLRALVMKTYGVGGIGNTARTCSEGTSEHSDGRAWDWMVDVNKPKERAAAADFLAWLTRNDGEMARRLGIMYVIYNKMIWASYRSKDGWRPSSGHTDHIHVSFSWNGARGNTSWWKGAPQPVDYGPCQRFAHQPSAIKTAVNTSRCPAVSPLLKTTSMPTLEYGARHSAVSTAQSLLGLPTTGSFDLTMRKKVMKWQSANNLPKTGGLDQPTWAALRPSSIKTDVAKEYSVSSARNAGARDYGNLTLRIPSVGRPVLVLQRALGMPARQVTGYYGMATKAAVRAKQKELKLPVTGRWTAADWRALARS